MSVNQYSSNGKRSSSVTERHERTHDALSEQARVRGRKVALIDGTSSYSYEFLSSRVGCNAGILTRNGLEPGDRVAIFLDKNVEAVIALYSVWMAGGVAVPLNEGLRARQVEHILCDSGSKYLLSDECKLARLNMKLPKDIAVHSVDMAASGSDTDQDRDSKDYSEAAAILYTSGSTGLPKGILISHSNLLAGTRIVSRYLKIQEDERIISILPFSFDYGLNQLLTSIFCGATLVLQRSHFPADICRTLLTHEITAMAAVPPLWIQLMQDYSPFSGMSFPKLRYITNSGGVFPTDLVKRYRAVLPQTRIYLMYGLSEAFRSTFLPPDQIDFRPDSIGKAIPETDLYVLHESGRECRPGEVGELVHRGPTVALGYWRDDEATAATFRRNPFASADSRERVVYSGDLVKKDEQGYLYFLGRRDQLIKSHGYRVSPEEVEEIILASGLVSEAVVCGKPDPVSGAAIVAHVVPRSRDAFLDAQLLAYCRREMPTYMLPREVRMHSSLPRTTSGKIDRKSLAQ